MKTNLQSNLDAELKKTPPRCGVDPGGQGNLLDRDRSRCLKIPGAKFPPGKTDAERMLHRTFLILGKFAINGLPY